MMKSRCPLQVIPGLPDKMNTGSTDWGRQGLYSYGCGNTVMIIEPGLASGSIPWEGSQMNRSNNTIQSLDAHLHPVTKTRFSPYEEFASCDTPCIATGDQRGTILVWNIAKGEAVCVCSPPSSSEGTSGDRNNLGSLLQTSFSATAGIFARNKMKSKAAREEFNSTSSLDPPCEDETPSISPVSTARKKSRNSGRSPENSHHSRTQSSALDNFRSFFGRLAGVESDGGVEGRGGASGEGEWTMDSRCAVADIQWHPKEHDKFIAAYRNSVIAFWALPPSEKRSEVGVQATLLWTMDTGGLLSGLAFDHFEPNRVGVASHDGWVHILRINPLETKSKTQSQTPINPATIESKFRLRLSSPESSRKNLSDSKKDKGNDDSSRDTKEGLIRVIFCLFDEGVVCLVYASRLMLFATADNTTLASAVLPRQFRKAFGPIASAESIQPYPRLIAAFHKQANISLWGISDKRSSRDLSERKSRDSRDYRIRILRSICLVSAQLRPSLGDLLGVSIRPRPPGIPGDSPGPIYFDVCGVASVSGDSLSWRLSWDGDSNDSNDSSHPCWMGAGVWSFELHSFKEAAVSRISSLSPEGTWTMNANDTRGSGRLAVGGAHGDVSIISVCGGQVKQKFMVSQGNPIRGVSWARENLIIFYTIHKSNKGGGRIKNKVGILDVTDGGVTYLKNSHDRGALTNMDLSPDRKYALLMFNSQAAQIIDLEAALCPSFVNEGILPRGVRFSIGIVGISGCFIGFSKPMSDAEDVEDTLGLSLRPLASSPKSGNLTEKTGDSKNSGIPKSISRPGISPKSIEIPRIPPKDTGDTIDSKVSPEEIEKISFFYVVSPEGVLHLLGLGKNKKALHLFPNLFRYKDGMEYKKGRRRKKRRPPAESPVPCITSIAAKDGYIALGTPSGGIIVLAPQHRGSLATKRGKGALPTSSAARPREVVVVLPPSAVITSEEGSGMCISLEFTPSPYLYHVLSCSDSGVFDVIDAETGTRLSAPPSSDKLLSSIVAGEGAEIDPQFTTAYHKGCLSCQVGWLGPTGTQVVAGGIAGSGIRILDVSLSLTNSPFEHRLLRLSPSPTPSPTPAHSPVFPGIPQTVRRFCETLRAEVEGWNPGTLRNPGGGVPLSLLGREELEIVYLMLVLGVGEEGGESAGGVEARREEKDSLTQPVESTRKWSGKRRRLLGRALGDATRDFQRCLRESPALPGDSPAVKLIRRCFAAAKVIGQWERMRFWAFLCLRLRQISIRPPMPMQAPTSSKPLPAQTSPPTQPKPKPLPAQTQSLPNPTIKLDAKRDPRDFAGIPGFSAGAWGPGVGIDLMVGKVRVEGEEEAGEGEGGNGVLKEVESLVFSGDTRRSISILLARGSRRLEMFACALAGGLAAEDPEYVRGIVYEVATRKLQRGEMEIGIQLLASIGVANEACLHLQSLGRWKAAAALAISRLTGRKRNDVLSRWGTHLAKKEKRKQAGFIFMAAGHIDKLVMLLREQGKHIDAMLIVLSSLLPPSVAGTSVHTDAAGVASGIIPGFEIPPLAALETFSRGMEILDNLGLASTAKILQESLVRELQAKIEDSQESQKSRECRESPRSPPLIPSAESATA